MENIVNNDKESVVLDIEKKDRSVFIRKIDKFTGDGDIRNLDKYLLFLEKGEHSFDNNFIKFILGYTNIYERDLTNWKSLYRFIYGDK